MDGVGCGELPDAIDFGDQGANTLGNLSRHFVDGLKLPNLQRLGLGNVLEIRGVDPAPSGEAEGCWGRCIEKSKGKDSTTGHWEMAGVVLDRPFPTYPAGFPAEILGEFTEKIGREILGNKAASGTEIIEELGAEHLRTGRPIVYTSADSVFQIAAHESVYSEEALYDICRIAREILTGPHAVGRVIARPFVGEPASFRRTTGRHDFSLTPPSATLLDRLVEASIPTIGIGKIGDLFAHQGLSVEIPTQSNAEGIEATIAQMTGANAPALIFTNLVEFDMIYGHRNDCEGYRSALEAFDARLPEIRAAQKPGDLVILTSDHGVDPTTPGTDHTREHSLLLAWGEPFGQRVDLRMDLGGDLGMDLGTRSTFADIGQTVADHLGCGPLENGQSFLGEMQS